MPGGYFNIVAEGTNNVILTGNPSKTFFKVTYAKHTNFGMQKFRIDYDGQRDLRLSEPSVFTFKIPKYADLLMDTYLVLSLPNIWSPIYHPSYLTNNKWVPYDFRWIRDIGTHLIKEIEIKCGSFTLQKCSGEYLAAVSKRDFDVNKRQKFDKMTGNVPELYDPANSYGRANVYPSAYYTDFANGAEPSIRGRNLIIPIGQWFTFDSTLAFPLVSLQYQELTISVTLRPIRELYQIRDIADSANYYPYVAPDYVKDEQQLYRFLQTPPAVNLTSGSYGNQTNSWNADIHLIANYCFLTKEEAKTFAAEDQIYLIKDVFEYRYENVAGSRRLKVESTGMVSSWMWNFQRNDVSMRNEWSNYTNWPYRTIPSDIYIAPRDGTDPAIINSVTGEQTGPGIHPDNTTTGLFITGDFAVDNQYTIMQYMGIVLNGEFRENTMPPEIYQYMEPYSHSKGTVMDGLYAYNFCLNTTLTDYQPSGALNMSKFKTVELDFGTYVPPVDIVKSTYTVDCDGDGNIIVVTNSNSWQLYDYNFNLTLFEERYNILSFIGGSCGLLYAR